MPRTNGWKAFLTIIMTDCKMEFRRALCLVVFFPADDPEGLLLIDSWENQEALSRYHSSPAMKEAAALREKYDLGGRTVRMYSPIMPERRQEPPEKNSWK